MVESAALEPPSNEAPWQPVTLPHAWFRHLPQGFRVVWYRIPFELAEKPRAPQRLFLRRVIVHTMDFHLNGRPFVAHRDFAAPAQPITSLELRVPAERLNAGANVLHVRVAASPEWLQGMSRVYLGPHGEIRARANLWRLAQVEVVMIFGVGFGMIGLLSLFLWLADRDRAMLWYGAIGTVFGLVTLLWFLTLPLGNMSLTRPMIYVRFFGFVTPIAILQLRLSGRRWPWLEAALWLVLAAACALMAVRNPWQYLVWNLSMLAVPALLLACSLALLQPRVPVPALTRNMLLLAGIAAAFIGVHDVLLRTGYLDFDRPWLYYYLVPVFMITAGAAILERLIAGVRRLRDANIELESRVAAKSREIAQAHERNAAAERERALAGERRRIMADMHDVLGSRLVGLLSLVQSGKAPREQLEQELAASLDELRMTIDSVQPVEGRSRRGAGQRAPPHALGVRRDRRGARLAGRRSAGHGGAHAGARAGDPAPAAGGVHQRAQAFRGQDRAREHRARRPQRADRHRGRRPRLRGRPLQRRARHRQSFHARGGGGRHAFDFHRSGRRHAGHADAASRAGRPTQ